MKHTFGSLKDALPSRPPHGGRGLKLASGSKTLEEHVAPRTGGAD